MWVRSCGVACVFRVLDLRDHAFNGVLESRQVFGHGRPDGRYVRFRVIMDEDVPHPRDLLPWYIWVLVSQIPRQLRGGLSDNGDLTNDRILDHRVGEEAIFSGFGVPSNKPDRGANVAKVNVRVPLGVHSGRDSERI